MSCLRKACLLNATEQCSVCARIYCSRECFVGDNAHRCVHPPSAKSKGRVLNDFAKDARRNERGFAMVDETSEVQIAYASLKPGEVIKKEVHVGVTQIVRIESGNGSVVFFSADGFENEKKIIREGALIVIPGSIYHEIRADRGVVLKVSSLYAPPTTH